MLSAIVPLELQDWVADRTTQGGLALHIRPAAGSDLETLRAFFGTVSVEDLRHRFSDAVDEAADIDLSEMVADRDPACVTFLAFDPAKALLACATLSDAPEGDTAQVALSVVQDAKGKGVSWTLLEHVLAYARSHGLKLVTSLESGDDRTAINLEREMGFVARLFSANPVEVILSKVVGDA